MVKNYPIPTKYRNKVNDEIEKMIKLNIIERSESQLYISPLVITIKKDGKVRVCLDARELNKRLKNDHDGPIEMNEIFKKCVNNTIMSSIDLNMSFWQIGLCPESRKYTGFLFNGKTYHFKVVPFGLKVSSGALTRASEKILKWLSNFIIDFVDDWICLSKNFDEHMNQLRILFTRIRDEGITINLRKVRFCLKS